MISLRGNEFPNPAGLVRFISQNVATVKVRPDHKIVYMRRWDTAEQRVQGTRRLLEQLAEIAVEQTA